MWHINWYHHLTNHLQKPYYPTLNDCQSSSMSDTVRFNNFHRILHNIMWSGHVIHERIEKDEEREERKREGGRKGERGGQEKGGGGGGRKRKEGRGQHHTGCHLNSRTVLGTPLINTSPFLWVYSEFQLLHAVSRYGFASIILFVLHGFHDFSAQIWIKTRGWHISRILTYPQTDDKFSIIYIFSLIVTGFNGCL